MDADIHADLTRRLMADFGFRIQSNWLRGGRCPNCNERELYTHSEGPWVIRCGRLGKCGWETGIRDLYPDAFAQFNKRFPATEAAPTATADAYLRLVRGIDPAQVRGWYSQGRYWHPDGDKGTATVRFDVAPGVWMERFVEEVTVGKGAERETRKAHFQGSHKGLWWSPPGQEIGPGDEVWLVEACLDAMVLALIGVKSCAVLSCVNYPTAAETLHRQHQGITWVWALDHDEAGKRWTIKHVERMRKEGLTATAAQVPPSGKKKQDWNDLHLRRELTHKDLEDFRYYGKLLIAKTPTEKALLMYQDDEKESFVFEFRDRTFWFSLDLAKFQKAVEQQKSVDGGLTEEQMREQALRECGAIHEIANCYPQALYYQSAALTDEAWYYFRVTFPHGGKPVKGTFTGGQLASASELKKRLLGVAPGALWTGSSAHLDRLLRQQIHGIKTVETVDFVGYSREFGAWIFPDTAIKDGKRCQLNDEDYFELGPKTAVKTMCQSISMHIGNVRDYDPSWVEDLALAFGPTGLAALAFWFGSLFAEQLRDRQKSFPFLEITGEPGGGKTTLIEFLWKLMGRRDTEGFDPVKSTLAGRARNFAQVSGMPVVLIEADRGGEDANHKRQFDWDELKPMFNGRSVRSRGVNNRGNDTYEPPFRGTVVISQNASVDASEAILQRIVLLNMTTKGHTAETRAAADRLAVVPVERVSHFLAEACSREASVLPVIFSRSAEWEKSLHAIPDLKSPRIVKNHAQILACLGALTHCLKMPEGAYQAAEDFLVDCAVDRQRAINADHAIVLEFWELFDYLNGDDSNDPRLNHSKEGSLIAVNLNHFVQAAENAKQQVPQLVDLKRHLRTSKARRYLDQRVVGSAIWRTDLGGPKSVRCWVFQK